VPDRLHEHCQLVVDIEVRKARPILHEPIQEANADMDSVLGEESEGSHEEAMVDSQSEGEMQYEDVPSITGEDIYPEEILTYKQRPRAV
jgi:hypothetical protein